MTAALHARKFLERNCLQYQLNGATYSSRHFSSQIISTIEPANIRAVLSANFEHYDIPWRRKNAFAPLLGRSLFQLDGHAWATSRSILKHAFGHAQVNDLSAMEGPVKQMLDSLRHNSSEGTIVDLAPFFDHLAATLTTNFIRGDPVQSPAHSGGISEKEFLAAMKAAGRGCEKRCRSTTEISPRFNSTWTLTST
jgi:cytochrome P450